MAIWIVGAFVKISVFYYVSALGTAQWLNLSDYRSVVLPLGILIVEFSFWSLPNTMDLAIFLKRSSHYYELLLQTIIPLFLLGLLLLGKEKKEKKTKFHEIEEFVIWLEALINIIWRVILFFYTITERRKMMEKGKISSLQMAFMMYPTIMATAILGVPSITAKYAKNDLWLSPILASLIGYVTVYIAYKLHKLYPKQTVIQFSEQIIGRFAGKMFGFLFLFFYIQGTGHVIRGYAEFIVDSFLVNTPISVIMASMVFLCAFIVSGGLEVLGRAAELFFPIFIFPLLILIILLIPDLEFKNIFPILGDGMIPPMKGAIVPGGMVRGIFSSHFFPAFFSGSEKRNEIWNDDCFCRDDDVSGGESYRSFCTWANDSL